MSSRSQASGCQLDRMPQWNCANSRSKRVLGLSGLGSLPGRLELSRGRRCDRLVVEVAEGSGPLLEPRAVVGLDREAFGLEPFGCELVDRADLFGHRFHGIRGGRRKSIEKTAPSHFDQAWSSRILPSGSLT